MSYKIGQVTTARLADDCITSAKLADDSILSAAIADDQVVSAAIADDQILAAAIATNAVVADGLADNAVDSAAIIDGAVLSAKLEDNISVAGNLVVAGNLSVTGNASEIHLEELKIDEATMTLNREDSTTYTSLVSAGDIGLIVKGGSDEDVKMVFDLNGSNPRVNFKDESGDFIEVKGGAGTFTHDLTARSVSFGSGPNSLNFSHSTGAVDASGAITATGGFVGDVTGDVTGDVSGSSGTCTGLAGSATVLATARNIAGQSFDGSGNITIATTDLSDAASFNAPTATSAAAWTTARTITLGGDLSGSVSLDGSANVTLTASIDSIGEVVALGTDTTGNYLQTLACSDDAITVANGATEGGAATLTLSSHLEGVHDAVAGVNSGSGPSGSQQYYVTHANGSTNANLTGSTGRNLMGADSDSAGRNTLGLGTGRYGDLKTADKRLIESLTFARPYTGDSPGGSNLFSNSAMGNAYKGTYVLDATAATGAVTFSLPLLHASDDGSSKMPLGACMKIKLSAVGSGGSITLSKPSGAAAATKIDGADTFVINEANQAITVFAGQDANSVMQYFIV